jgi:SAM-dependent methyltransferase
VARTRAHFAAQKLDCFCLTDPVDVPASVDCFFASHVLEHLADPNLLWATASQVLRPGGCVVIFVPNGEPSRERVRAQHYHQLWGRVHPLLLTAESLCRMAHRHGYGGTAYSSPYDLAAIGNKTPGRLDGDELLFIARKRP